MDAPEVYRTESGTIFRVLKDKEGHLAVERLGPSAWESGPIGMAGLRLARTTTRLTQRQVESLTARLDASA
jgi:hypothetical protein